MVNVLLSAEVTIVVKVWHKCVLPTLFSISIKHKRVQGKSKKFEDGIKLFIVIYDSIISDKKNTCGFYKLHVSRIFAMCTSIEQ